MLILFISYILIFFILYTFGDMLLMLYNRICRNTEEEYNIIDKLLLGLCALIIPLSLWSLWLPSNHIFLGVTTIFAFIYWCINFRKAGIIYNSFNLKSISLSQQVLIISFFAVCLFFFSWQQEVYDSAFYHFQNIRWNEEYAVVPGVANIDDRFGFNSNYFLLSAIFTFRFIFSEAIYPLQPFLVTVIGIWVISEYIRSKYEIKRFVILLSYILFFGVSIYFLGNTSTDILPNLIVFYILARIILNPQLLKKQSLLLVILPVFLLTSKLSFFPIAIISLYLLYYQAREKKYRTIWFMLIIGLLIMVPWLIRNTIISGYLIYPLYQIDLFSFDWKVPQEVAVKEKDYIFDVGYYFFRTAVRYPHMNVRDTLAINILTDIIYIFTLISFCIFIYKAARNKQEGKHIYLLYIMFFVTCIIWATGGPDIRFVSGVLCAIIFIGIILLVGNKDIYLHKTGDIIACIFIISIVIWTSSRFYDFYPKIKKPDTHLVRHILLKPFSVKDQQTVQNIDITKKFVPYPINNNLFIWVGSDLPYDMPPPASIHSHYAKFLQIECLEARGNKVQDGYRSKMYKL